MSGCVRFAAQVLKPFLLQVALHQVFTWTVPQVRYGQATLWAGESAQQSPFARLPQRLQVFSRMVWIAALEQLLLSAKRCLLPD